MTNLLTNLDLTNVLTTKVLAITSIGLFSLATYLFMTSPNYSETSSEDLLDNTSLDTVLQSQTEIASEESTITDTDHYFTYYDSTPLDLPTINYSSDEIIDWITSSWSMGKTDQIIQKESSTVDSSTNTSSNLFIGTRPYIINKDKKIIG